MATDRTNKDGKYAAKVKLTTPGRTSFRVVKPHSSKARTGKSKARTRTVWGWLNLAQQPRFTSGTTVEDITSRVHHRRYRHSFEFLSAGSGFFFKPHGACDLLRAKFAWADGSGDPTDAVITIESTSLASPPAPVTANESAIGSINTMIKGSDFGGVFVTDAQPGSLGSSGPPLVALMTPRVHCSIPKLSEMYFSDLPT